MKPEDNTGKVEVEISGKVETSKMCIWKLQNGIKGVPGSVAVGESVNPQIKVIPECGPNGGQVKWKLGDKSLGSGRTITWEITKSDLPDKNSKKKSQKISVTVEGKTKTVNRSKSVKINQCKKDGDCPGKGACGIGKCLSGMCELRGDDSKCSNGLCGGDDWNCINIDKKSGPRGAELDGLEEEARTTFDDVEQTAEENNAPEPTITSGVRENDKDSLHSEGQAIDLRGNNVSDQKLENMAADLQNDLGTEYDVVPENNFENPNRDHIHIEYDPPKP